MASFFQLGSSSFRQAGHIAGRGVRFVILSPGSFRELTDKANWLRFFSSVGVRFVRAFSAGKVRFAILWQSGCCLSIETGQAALFSSVVSHRRKSDVATGVKWLRVRFVRYLITAKGEFVSHPAVRVRSVSRPQKGPEKPGTGHQIPD